MAFTILLHGRESVVTTQFALPTAYPFCIKTGTQRHPSFYEILEMQGWLSSVTTCWWHPGYLLITLLVKYDIEDHPRKQYRMYQTQQQDALMARMQPFRMWRPITAYLLPPTLSSLESWQANTIWVNIYSIACHSINDEFRNQLKIIPLIELPMLARDNRVISRPVCTRE